MDPQNEPPLWSDLLIVALMVATALLVVYLGRHG